MKELLELKEKYEKEIKELEFNIKAVDGFFQFNTKRGEELVSKLNDKKDFLKLINITYDLNGRK